MSAVSANLVRELREATGAGMMECKKALESIVNSGATGDLIELAIEEMRKSGQAKAAKKASRSASEGVVAIRLSSDSHVAVMIEVNSETDFVARDQSFNEFVKVVAEVALANQAKTLEELLASATPSGDTVDQARQALIAKIGENINVRRLQYFSTTGALGTYVHGGRIGVVVEVEGNHADLARDLAMHVAASSPMVVAAKDVPAEVIAKEREIYIAQAMESGKPKEIAEKMVEGRLRKFLEEVSLLGQPFVKDPSMTVDALVKNAKTSVVRFTRFEVGEGIEKKVVDFAKEVMEQVRGS
jgi:elongation factor Ts